MKEDGLNTNEKWRAYLKCIMEYVEGGLDMQKLDHFRKALKPSLCLGQFQLGTSIPPDNPRGLAPKNCSGVEI